ncbi:MAG TPA: ABC transporter ATP-binding protein [Flavobacteriaceae bacterium]|nr:lipoprotein-releasing system ATP-binding protein LolD [Flavobacteriaceae bacterium]MDP7183522.1 ABC transporter ATP-binding protein [Flavobacteriaceae bacterium]HJO70335.1 ABC transporter ATP-binding protein [Flavobacteriaceae bacterium]
MLLAKNISKSFDGTKVLKEINLSINQGEIISISGPSGAGKTTLLNILGTIETPDDNNDSKLMICERDIFGLNDKELSNFRNKNIGFVFQFHELLPEFTCLENVCLPAWIGKNNNIKERAISLFKELGLIDKLDKKPATLSGGERQRVSVARALINNPKIILADEPSGNLDSKNSEILYDIFFDLRKKINCTFIIVTHNQSLAKKADRQIVINDGKII